MGYLAPRPSQSMRPVAGIVGTQAKPEHESGVDYYQQSLGPRLMKSVQITSSTDILNGQTKATVNVFSVGSCFSSCRGEGLCTYILP